MTRVLVTGSGGLAGVNFVRALRAASRDYYIVGTDFNKYHLLYPDVDARYLSPRHSDKSFIPRIVEIARKEKADFLHPQPSSEAYVISSKRKRVPCRVFLPSASVMRVGQDKLLSEKRLKAEVLRAYHLAGRRLHQRRAAEEDGALVLHDDALVRHRRHIGAAGSAGAHHHGDLRNPQRRHIGLVVEDTAEMLAVGKHFRLRRQIGAA